MKRKIASTRYLPTCNLQIIVLFLVVAVLLLYENAWQQGAPRYEREMPPRFQRAILLMVQLFVLNVVLNLLLKEFYFLARLIQIEIHGIAPDAGELCVPDDLFY